MRRLAAGREEEHLFFRLFARRYGREGSLPAVGSTAPAGMKLPALSTLVCFEHSGGIATHIALPHTYLPAGQEEPSLQAASAFVPCPSLPAWAGVLEFFDMLPSPTTSFPLPSL